MADKKCEECRWFYLTLSRGDFACSNPAVFEWYAADARSEDSDCGPSARYYEPKDSNDDRD